MGFTKKRVKVTVPSSSANLGIGYDIWSLALEKPNLTLTYTKKKPGGGILVTGDKLQSGLIPGYSGKLALENFFNFFDIKDGAHLVYETKDYSTGGLGRSGAEAVAAIIAASIIYNKKLKLSELVGLSSWGEPSGHIDNVAASMNGNFNIVYGSLLSKNNCHVLSAPSNLGVLIGSSSHENGGGTITARNILKTDISAEDFIYQSGAISAATASLVSGDINDFLSIIIRDIYHESYRASAGLYGNFHSEEFFELKMKLFKDFHVALTVSGAGPSMLFLYNKDLYRGGLFKNALFKRIVTDWFEDKDIVMTLKETEIAKTGAYEYLK